MNARSSGNDYEERPAGRARGSAASSRAICGLCKAGRSDRGITGDEYDRKARELKERQTEITLQIAQHQKGEDGYRITLETLISVASRAAELFERSKTEQKRELLAFVFSNLRLRGKTLEFSLRSPFDLMANRADHASWLAFLHTVRTERFQEILGLGGLLPLVARVA
jgi:hypothetical protein